MNFIPPLVFVVAAAIGQVSVSSGVDNRYEEYRRSGLTSLLQANYKQAEDDFRNALAEARRLGSSDRRVATALGDLGVLYRETNRLSDAEDLLQQSVTILQTNDPHHDLCLFLKALGEVYLAESRIKDAERTLIVALSLARNGRGPTDDAVADVLATIGLLQLKQRKYRQAEESFQGSLEIRQRSQPGNNLDVAKTLNDLGTLYTLHAMRSNYSKAEEVLKRSLKIAEEVLRPDHPALSDILENLAVVENKLHHFEASETYFERTIAIQTKAAAIDRPELLAVYANTLTNLNRKDEAAALLAQVKRLLAEQRFIIKAKR